MEHATVRAFKTLALAAGVVALAALVGAGWALATGGSFPPGGGAAAHGSLPPDLARLIGSARVALVREFDTERDGLKGYVVRSGSPLQILYGEDGYLFAGDLRSPTGESLTARDAGRYIPKPHVASAMKRLATDTHLVLEGPTTAPGLYVFADADCIFCHLFYGAVEPPVAAGKLQLRWVLVGVLGQSSVARAAAILASRDPAAALRANETSFDGQSEAGGIAPLQDVPAALQSTIAVHTAAMQELGASNAWAVTPGMPAPGWLKAHAGAGRG